MTDLSMGTTPANIHAKAGAAALLLLALTSVHHVYGAVTFDTPWRLHILHIAAPVALVIVAMLYVGRTNWNAPGGRIATWIAAAIILVFPVAVIGVYEGAYNHLVKNIVYFVFGESSARTLFPAPTYEMPSNLIFEMTGIVQFPVAVLTTILTISMLRGGDR